MAAEYIDILRTELERQRQFLSEEEEQVLLKPALYESEDDLALDSGKAPAAQLCPHPPRPFRPRWSAVGAVVGRSV